MTTKYSNDSIVITLTRSTAFYSSVHHSRPVEITRERALALIAQHKLTVSA